LRGVTAELHDGPWSAASSLGRAISPLRLAGAAVATAFLRGAHVLVRLSDEAIGAADSAARSAVFKLRSISPKRKLDGGLFILLARQVL
jgi:hypothetical protein